ncbi:PanM family protein [Pseudomonas sp. MAP12]|uniref:PanM family protein n=1 Tax=Geopseudomonas aromaticivorans TaxID=2849492 RepID=A0ABS6MXY9_9GAMM|nr:acetyl-CoA sensor PanZ family protein [Pseudomonas aromaticivorans]MBV2133410.1 PanM family protein [Pseudomonas aromaticivorans]
MPVIAEAVTQPSAQDRTDLEKIYADAPAWLLAPYPDAASLIDAGLAAGSLIAGRFNDRLLGAAWLAQDADGWQLSHLCVRKLTRGRGVAARLVAEARRRAAETNQPLRLLAPPRHLEVQAWAHRLELPLQEQEV